MASMFSASRVVSVDKLLVSKENATTTGCRIFSKDKCFQRMLEVPRWGCNSPPEYLIEVEYKCAEMSSRLCTATQESGILQESEAGPGVVPCCQLCKDLGYD